MTRLRYHPADNHDHPGFQAVLKAHPDAVRIHYSDSMFPSMSGWRVAYPIECGGGSGLRWEKVQTPTTGGNSNEQTEL